MFFYVSYKINVLGNNLSFEDSENCCDESDTVESDHNSSINESGTGVDNTSGIGVDNTTSEEEVKSVDE